MRRLRHAFFGLAIVAAGTAATVASPQPAAARCRSCGAGYPEYFTTYDGLVLGTLYYGGFYTPRVVFAPRLDRSYLTPHGLLVPYRNVRRTW